jgi:hypothetical protein
MQKSPELGRAWLNCTQVGGIVLAHIFERQINSLEEVSFLCTGNSISCQFGITVVVDVIQKCRSLKYLCFNNDFSTPLLVAILRHGLPNHPSLRILELRDVEGKNVAEALHFLLTCAPPNLKKLAIKFSGLS